MTAKRQSPRDKRAVVKVRRKEKQKGRATRRGVNGILKRDFVELNCEIYGRFASANIRAKQERRRFYAFETHGQTFARCDVLVFKENKKEKKVQRVELYSAANNIILSNKTETREFSR